MIGTAVLDEQVYPILDVRLRNGQVQFVFEIPPSERVVVNEGEHMIFGEDGELIFTGYHGNAGFKPEGVTWRVTYTLQGVGKIGERALAARRARRRRR